MVNKRVETYQGMQDIMQMWLVTVSLIHTNVDLIAQIGDKREG